MLYKIRKVFNINSMLNVRSEVFEAMNIYIVFACVSSSMIKTEAPICSYGSFDVLFTSDQTIRHRDYRRPQPQP
jgi:hypothetical protein